MLIGTWSQAHAYDPSDYLETRLNNVRNLKQLAWVESFSFKIRVNVSCMYHVCIMNTSEMYHKCNILKERP